MKVDDDVFVATTPDTGPVEPNTSTIVVTPSRKRKNDSDDLDTPRMKRRQTPLATSGKKGGSEKKNKVKSLITNHFLKFSLVRREGHGGHAVPDAARAVAGGGGGYQAVQGARAKTHTGLARGGEPRQLVPDDTIGQNQAAAITLSNRNQ